MPRKNPLPKRELEICRRLRAFRLSTKLSQTAFASQIGVDSTRLASYEHGRAPLPFEVYKAVNQKYSLNPMWLATGDGPPSAHWGIPYGLGPQETEISARAKFSEAYDLYLAADCESGVEMARARRSRFLRAAEDFAIFIKEHPDFEWDPEEMRELLEQSRALEGKIRDLLKSHRVVN